MIRSSRNELCVDRGYLLYAEYLACRAHIAARAIFLSWMFSITLIYDVLPDAARHYGNAWHMLKFGWPDIHPLET